MRKRKWQTETDAHTTSVAKPETATNAKYTVEAATTEDSNANSDPAILKSTANTGTPWKFVLPSARGIIPSCASDQTIREHTYKPEFAADSTAVNTTKFITSPANGMPIDWNTSTNGLVSTPD